MRQIILLIALTCIVFAPSLFNDFTGDDQYFIKQNVFYDNLKNIPRLFHPDEYTINSNDYFFKSSEDKGTGSVAYRPVLSLTYFADSLVWGKRPFGFHLTNLLFHLMNVLLVLFIFRALLPKQAEFIALIFSLHPIQAEAVCSIGYRADLVAAFWILFAFLMWVYYRQRSSIKYFYGAVLGYFLALFSKESAAPAIAVFFLYDQMIHDKAGSKSKLFDYATLSVTLGFYSYVYFVLFPNTALIPAEGTYNLKTHLLDILFIFNQHLSSILWPFQITLIPTLYLPLFKVEGAMLLWPVLFIACLYALRQQKTYTFCLLWFLVFYLPVSYIVFHPNPLGYRLMYLPSVGVLALVAVLTDIMILKLASRKGFSRISHMLKPVIILMLMICTIPITFLWKNNMTIAKVWVAKFPDHFKGHEILAKELYKLNRFEDAIISYEKTLLLNNHNPSVYYELGQSYLKTGDLHRAADYFEQTVLRYPHYLNGYVGLMRIHYLNKNETSEGRVLADAQGKLTTTDFEKLLSEKEKLKKRAIK